MKCPNPECKNKKLGEDHTFCFDCGLRILKPNEEASSPSFDDKSKTHTTNEEDSDVQEDTDVSRGKTGEYKSIPVGAVVIELDSFEKKE